MEPDDIDAMKKELIDIVEQLNKEGFFENEESYKKALENVNADGEKFRKP